MLKKLLIAIVSICSCLNLSANDTFIEISSGAMSNIELKKNNQIQMISEIIEITLYDDFYQINVDFNFYNHGLSTEIEVGFPQWQDGTRGDFDFIEFKTSVNGEDKKFHEVNANIELSGGSLLINKWFVRTIKFPEKEYTRTNVNYKVPYGSYQNGAAYLFGTGSTWREDIKNITIIIKNKSERWINNLEINGVDDFTPENHNDVIEINLHNITPNISDEILIDANSVPSGLISLKRINPDKYWFYRSEIILQKGLRYLKKSQLRLLRNLIFAGNGHIFESKDINDWLNNYCDDWYKPIRRIGIDELTQNEKTNIRLIQIEENKR